VISCTNLPNGEMNRKSVFLPVRVPASDYRFPGHIGAFFPSKTISRNSCCYGTPLALVPTLLAKGPQAGAVPRRDGYRTEAQETLYGKNSPALKPWT